MNPRARGRSTPATKLAGFVLAAGALLATSAGSASCLSTSGLAGGAAPGEDGGGAGDDGPVPNPCNADLMNDKVNCGSCGNVCPFNANSYPVCNAGKCGIACNTGFGNCDTNDANGCEAVLTNDPNNCSACGRGCFGGACNGSQCAAVVIANVNGRATGIAVDDQYVYYGFQGATASTAGISRIDKDGKQQAQVVAAPTQKEVWQIVADATSVYWATSSTSLSAAPDGAIWKAPKDGKTAPVSLVAKGLATAATDTGLAVDATNVYFTVYGLYDSTAMTYAGGVYKCAVAGCANAGALATTTRRPLAVAVDASTLFFSTLGDGTTGSQAIYKCGLSGCGGALPATPFAPSTSTPYSLALAGPNLFVGNDAAVTKFDAARGDATTLAASQRTVRSIAVDAANAYWPNYNGGTVVMCPVAGCNGNPTVVAANLQNPLFITADDKAVYWTNYATGGTSTVMKVAK